MLSSANRAKKYALAPSSTVNKPVAQIIYAYSDDFEDVKILEIGSQARESRKFKMNSLKVTQ